MREVLFSHDLINPQRGEFTFNSLDPEEKALVLSVVNWDNPSQYSHLFYEAHGRSILFQSPTEQFRPIDTMKGRFRGLQIYGAGGDPDMISEGIRLEKPAVIYPINEANHASTLSHLIQSRTLDENGQLKLWIRSYAPMHGMEKNEADRRKVTTRKLRSVSDFLLERGANSPFLVPELAAEGVFPDKKDLNGDTLRFQVYRVPILPRLPNQLMREISTKGLEEGIEFLEYSSAMAGQSLRILHQLNLAYIQGHVGNMTLLSDGDNVRMYLTDLGTIEDFSGHSFPERFKGMDIFVYIVSMEKLLSNLREHMAAKGLEEEANSIMLQASLQTVTTDLIHGYFEMELEKYIKKGMSLEEVNRLLLKLSSDILVQALEHWNKPQEFLEFFEGYYIKIKDQSSKYQQLPTPKR